MGGRACRSGTPSSIGAPASRLASPSLQRRRTYGQAFIVGLLNTLFVSLVGIVLATGLGVLIGVARLSPNWLVAKVAAGYVEVIRNTPLLVQLFLIYFAVLVQLPGVRESITLTGPIFLNQRGLFVPGPQLSATFGTWLALVGAGLAIAIGARILASRREAAGRRRILGRIALLVFVGARRRLGRRPHR